MKKLPFPRLELRWRKSNHKQDGDMVSYEWACDYILVLHAKTDSDCRSNGKNYEYAKLNVQYVLNTSYRSGGGTIPYAGDTPFRDGSHAMWDSITLNIPVFSIYKGKAKQVEITPECRKTFLER